MENNNSCFKHNNESFIMWCFQCTVLCCSDCIEFDHESHSFKGLKSWGNLNNQQSPPPNLIKNVTNSFQQLSTSSIDSTSSIISATNTTPPPERNFCYIKSDSTQQLSGGFSAPGVYNIPPQNPNYVPPQQQPIQYNNASNLYSSVDTSKLPPTRPLPTAPTRTPPPPQFTAKKQPSAQQPSNSQYQPQQMPLPMQQQQYQVPTTPYQQYQPQQMPLPMQQPQQYQPLSLQYQAPLPPIQQYQSQMHQVLQPIIGMPIIQSSTIPPPNPSLVLPVPNIMMIKRDIYITPKDSIETASFLLLINSKDPKVQIKKIAKKENHSGAQCWIGSSNLYGLNGYKINNEKAYTWLEKSARQDNPKGTYDLFKYYERISDTSKAVFWLERSAELGYEDAIITMGIYSFNGTLINQSYDKAFHYFQLGASLGVDSNVFTYLGLCFYHGRGVQINYEEAYRFFYLASKNPQKPEVAQYYLGDCLYFGKGVEVNYSLAFDYFTKSATTSGILGNFYKPSDSLGYCCLRGHGTTQNFQNAKIHFQNAKRLGSPIAEKNLKTTQKCIDHIKKPADIIRYIQENQEKELLQRQLEINQHQLSNNCDFDSKSSNSKNSNNNNNNNISKSKGSSNASGVMDVIGSTLDVTSSFLSFFSDD